MSTLSRKLDTALSPYKQTSHSGTQ